MQTLNALGNYSEVFMIIFDKSVTIAGRSSRPINSPA